ncbi:MAG: hypothetical protein ACK4YV_15375 [Emticicia sp.]
MPSNTFHKIKIKNFQNILKIQKGYFTLGYKYAYVLNYKSLKNKDVSNGIKRSERQVYPYMGYAGHAMGYKPHNGSDTRIAFAIV